MLQYLKKYGLPVIIVLALMYASFQVGGLAKELQLLKEGVVPAGTGAGLAQNGGAAAQQPAGPDAEDIAPVTDADYVRGNRNAKIALIEYSDYECPFCQRFHATAQQAVDEYDGEVMWIYRQFPLEAIHPNARPASIAAECVGRIAGNDAFWDYTDTLFSGISLAEDSLISNASNQGVDITTCLQNAETDDLVQEDLDSGQRVGITGTPGNILLNIETGESILIPGALPFVQVSQAIDSLL